MKNLMMIFLFVLTVCAPAFAAERPHLNDFARMMPLTLSGEGALHELLLPTEVYAWAKRSDLGDLAVFNGKGEIVPFTLIKPASVRTSMTGPRLPLFPLSAAPTRQRGDIAMQVRTDEHGAIVNLATSPGSVSGVVVSSYLVDASALNQPVSGFYVILTTVEKSSIGILRVETSDDLVQWRQYSTGAIATLSTGEHQLNKDRIEFPAVKARYFRLSIAPEQGAPRIDSITARLESPLTTQRHEKASYLVTPVKGTNGEYLVRTGGQAPIDRLRLIFPDENSLASVTFMSRPDDKSPWIDRGCGTFYRLRRDATIVENGPLEIAPTTDNQWLLRVRKSNSGLGDSLPRLEVGWLPHRLIFAARGEAPFRLAYGSERTGLDIFRDDSLTAGLTTWEQQQIKPLTAQAGTSVESGGRQALRPRIPAMTWRKALLWGALLLGVLLLSGMAWKMVREMGLDNTHKN